jgi:hypothetical protein
VCCGFVRSIAVFRKTRNWTVLSQLNPAQQLHPISLTNIILHETVSLPSGIFFEIFRPKCFYLFLVSSACSTLPADRISDLISQTLYVNYRLQVPGYVMSYIFLLCPLSWVEICSSALLVYRLETWTLTEGNKQNNFWQEVTSLNFLLIINELPLHQAYRFETLQRIFLQITEYRKWKSWLFYCHQYLSIQAVVNINVSSFLFVP